MITNNQQVIHPLAPLETIFFFEVKIPYSKGTSQYYRKMGIIEIKISPRYGDNEKTAWNKIKMLYPQSNAVHKFIKMKESDT